MSRRVSLVVTVDGQPYAAGTLGCPMSITSADTDWPAGVVVLPGAISKETRWQWSEDLKPTTGELSVSSLTVVLDDLIAASGPAASQRVWSYLYSRRTRSIKSAPIASPGISASDTSIIVASDPGYGTGAQTIWIDREAIRCSGYNVGTKTFTVAASGRGYLGTRAASHYTDDVNTFTPLVWEEFPNPQRRRAIVWMVEDGVATPLWRGYVGRAPRLAANGAQWELQLDHAWTVQSQRALGPSRTSARIVGFEPSSFRVKLTHRGGGGSILDTFEVQREPISDPWPETIGAVGSSLVDRLNAMLALPASPMAGSVRAVVHDDSLRFETSMNADHELVVGPRIPQPVVMVPSPGVPTIDFYALAREVSAGSYQAIARLQYPFRTHVALIQGRPCEVPLDSVAGIPTSALSTAYTDDAITTTVQWCLQTRDMPGDQSFHLALSIVNATTRRVTGEVKRGWAGYARSNVAVQGNFLILQPIDLELVTRVDSGHWLYALKHGALSVAYGLDDQADPRDWSWSTADRVVGATSGESTTARMWIFDGSTKLGEFVKDACRLDVCALALHGSRLAFDVIDPPLPSETAAYTIDLTAGDGIHKSVSGYTSQPEGVVNVVRITSEEGPSITVNNQTSIALYGLSQPLEVEAKGAVAQIVADRSPFELARGPLSRAIGMWGEPTELLSVDAEIDALTSAELCSIVDVTSKAMPSGEGTRGVSTTRRGRVISRQVDLSRGTVRLGILVYPYNTAGYAPCFRVQAFGGAGNKIVTINASFISGASAANYADASDAGVSAITAGMFLRFRHVNSTSTIEEGGWEVASVNPAGPTITLVSDPSGGAVDWVAELAAGETLELLFDDYDAGVTATQRDYAFVGKRSTRTLDGSPLKEWAP